MVLDKVRHGLVNALCVASIRRSKANDAYRATQWTGDGMAKRVTWESYREAQRLEQLAEERLHEHERVTFQVVTA